MSIVIRIPTPLRKLTGGEESVAVDGCGNLAQAVDALESAHPGLKERLCDESGELRRFVNVYVNNEDARFISGLQTSLKPGDEVSIVPAVAGG